MDLSSPTILPPQVRVPSTPSMLLPFIVKFVLFLSREKNKNKQKEAGFGPFLKNVYLLNQKATLAYNLASFRLRTHSARINDLSTF